MTHVARISSLFVLAALATSSVGCGPHGHRGAARAHGPATIDPARWNGLWQTTFGPLAMTLDGGKVTGVYKYTNHGAEVVGVMKGTPDGDSLVFDWAEQSGGAGVGRGVFYFEGDGRSFTGTWGYHGSSTDGGEWVGKWVEALR